MIELDKRIQILESYKEDLQWSVWHLEVAENIADRKRKMDTLKEIIKDIGNEIVVLKGKRWKEYELENQKN